ncbi:putative alcohol dehydrogenase [Citrobacter koseri]|uniref:Putative alcohol dehydrogenase n=1 Tax=Citrobacter koseri TaxID=545 RepID=A0A447UMN2_CITKO|nr:putative alcohol dehydrogenase [Citrobacter koseri]
MAGDIQKALQERDIFSVIYDGTQPNPTTENVAAGLKLLKEHGCDSVISLGGGSPHDCAKGIALVAAKTAADIRDYEGVESLRETSATDDCHQHDGGNGIRNDPLLHHYRRSAPYQ